MYDLVFFCEKNRQEWNKACVDNNLQPRKLNILVKQDFILFFITSIFFA
jgi:hypothetical protein